MNYGLGQWKTEPAHSRPGWYTHAGGAGDQREMDDFWLKSYPMTLFSVPSIPVHLLKTIQEAIQHV
jgi:hypothetical protein